MRKFKSILLISLLSVSMLTGCGSSSSMMSNSTAMDFSSDMGADFITSEDGWSEEAIEDLSENTASYITGDKIVYTCNITIETLNYEDCINAIKKQISEFEGFIESENESDNDYGWYNTDYKKTTGTKRNTIVIRIPSKDYETFLSSIEGNGKVISKYTNAENISKSYYNTETLIKMYEKEEENLLEMMDRTSTISEMIEIEDRLSEVQYELLMAKNNLSSMDTDVEYSTITVNVREVMAYSNVPSDEPTTFFGKLAKSFVSGWTVFFNIIKFIIYAIVALIPEIIVVTLIIILIRKRIKKKKIKKQENKNN